MPQGGEIMITARPFPGVSEDTDWCEITIADTGQGIAREDRDKIFNPFFTTKTGGTGLGLAIVYRIIEDHRGTITVDSVPGKGTQFSSGFRWSKNRFTRTLKNDTGAGAEEAELI